MGLAARYAKRLAPGFLAALAFLALESACDLAQPALLARVLDEGVAQGDASVALRLGLVMLGFAALGAIGASGRNIIASIVSFRFGAELRAELFSSVLRMPANRSDTIDPGSIVTRQTSDVEQVQQFVNGMMRVFAKAPILATGALVMATRVEPALAWIPFTVVGVVSILVWFNLRLGIPRYAAVQAGIDRVNSSVRSFLGGIRVVRAFGRFSGERKRFGASNAGFTKAAVRAARTAAIFGPATALATNLGIAAILLSGGFNVLAGRVQTGRVVAFISYMTQILFALTIMSNVFSWFTRAKASYTRIVETLNADEPGKALTDNPIKPTGRSATADQRASPEGAPSLELRHVNFSYNNAGAPALLDIGFRCQPGTITAVTGSTGSGKTTLARLLLGFYDDYHGDILLDGDEMRALGKARLRARVSIAPQSPSLFTGTLARNIGWSLEHPDDGLIREAARIARIDDFADTLPEGFATMLGRGGINLSGGQRQRVSIARAIARILSGSGGLLIMDDCTSAVDVLTEARIREGIRAIVGKATVLWITQRASITASADMTVVLDNGRLSGAGPHAVLSGTCGVYHDILASQLGDGDDHERR